VAPGCSLSNLPIKVCLPAASTARTVKIEGDHEDFEPFEVNWFRKLHRGDFLEKVAVGNRPWNSSKSQNELIVPNDSLRQLRECLIPSRIAGKSAENAVGKPGFEGINPETYLIFQNWF
jgi:hypothetical protein